MLKPKRVLLVYVLLLLTFSGCATNDSSNQKSIATVNDEPITVSTFESRYNTLVKSMALNPDTLTQMNTASLSDVFKQLSVNELVDEALLRQYAKLHGIQISANEINALYLKESKFTHPLIVRTDFEQKLKKLGYTSLTFKEHLKTLLLKQKVATHLYGKSLQPAESEVNNYYQLHYRLYDVPEKVHVKHILIAANLEEAERQYRADNPNASELQVAKSIDESLSAKRLQASTLLRQLLHNPEKFDAYAGKYSADTVSAEQNGDLGLISFDMMPRSFSQVAFGTPVNQIAPQLVQTSFGFHIIKILGKYKPQKARFTEIRDSISEKLYEDKVEKILKKWLLSQYKTSKISYAQDYQQDLSLHAFQQSLTETASQSQKKLDQQVNNSELVLDVDKD